MIKKRAIVFLISDFLAPVGADDATPAFAKKLAVLAKKHDTIAITVEDPAERELPAISGIARFEDAEQPGAVHELDLRRGDLVSLLNQENARREEELERLFKHCGMDRLRLDTRGNFTDALADLFKKRQRRKTKGG